MEVNLNLNEDSFFPKVYLLPIFKVQDLTTFDMNQGSNWTNTPHATIECPTLGQIQNFFAPPPRPNCILPL